MNPSSYICEGNLSSILSILTIDNMEEVMDDLVYHVRRGNNAKALKIIKEHNLHPNEEIKYK